MPEGDTVYLAGQRLHAALAGQTLRRTDFRVPRLATTDLSGRTVNSVVSRGKHLLLRVSGGLTLHTHFRMDGTWHLYHPGERWRAPAWQARVVLATDPWLAVGFRLPVVALLPTAREAEVVGHLGPDPLADDWDPEEAVRRLAADPARVIGDALLDQRILAGPGNVYRCEICFLRGVNPWTPVGDVKDLPRLVDLVKRLFDVNRGSASHITTGDTRPGHQQWVYGRRGQPCRRCGTPIQRRDAPPGVEDDRITYWCPHCQPAPA